MGICSSFSYALRVQGWITERRATSEHSDSALNEPLMYGFLLDRPILKTKRTTARYNYYYH